MVSRTPHRRLIRSTIGCLLILVGALTCALILLAPMLGLTRIRADAAQPDVPTAVHLITFNFDGRNRSHKSVAAWVNQQRPDVLLIQETYPIFYDPLPGVSDLLPNVVEQQTSLHYRGVTILTRYPILDLEGYDTDSPYGRAVVQVQDRQIAIYNVSLTTPVSGSEDLDSPFDLIRSFDSTQRDAQLRQVIDRLDSETLPYIVAGDFNMMEIEPAYTWMSSRLTDVYAAIGSGVGATWPSRSPLIRIDYVWVTPDWCPLSAQTGPILGSDHLPLQVELAFSEHC